MHVSIGYDNLLGLECAMHWYDDERGTTVTEIKNDNKETYVQSLPNQNWVWNVADSAHPLIGEFESAGLTDLTPSR